MKKNRDYEINHVTGIITVRKDFLDKASQLDSGEFATLTQLKALGMQIKVDMHKTPAVTRKVLEARRKVVKLKEMERYIAVLDDAAVMMAEYETMQAAYRGQGTYLKRMNEWFAERFPHYHDMVPEFDDNNHIVHNPNPVVNPELKIAQ